MFNEGILNVRLIHAKKTVKHSHDFFPHGASQAGIRENWINAAIQSESPLAIKFCLAQ
jgi:hypothetical protein